MKESNAIHFNAWVTSKILRHGTFHFLFLLFFKDLPSGCRIVSNIKSFICIINNISVTKS